MKKKNIILLIIAIVLFVLVGSTMAYFGWTSTSENKDQLVDVTVSGGTGSCDKLSDNNKLLYPTSTREKGRILKVTTKQQMATNAFVTWNLVVNSINETTLTTSGLKHKSFKYELVNDTTGVSYGTGNFENVSNGTTITLSTDEETLDYNTEYTFILYLWIDGTIGNNPLDMTNQPYNFDLNCNITGTSTKITPQAPNNIAKYIRYQYNNAKKRQLTINDITVNTAPSVRLMNDRLGGTVGINDGNIRFYGDSQSEIMPAWQSGTTRTLAKNFFGGEFSSESDCRDKLTAMTDCSLSYSSLGFSSTSKCETALPKVLKESLGVLTRAELLNEYCTNDTYPLNNYIYFNCSDYSNQSSSTCETWRIIGVFGDKLKIMRGSSIDNYSWDNKNISTGAESAYGKNDWTTARLMKLLNPSDYYTIDSNDNGNGQSLYYYSQRGTCFSGQNNATTSCSFTSTGIKNDTTRNMIAETTWEMEDPIFKSGLYSGRPTTWTGKIAIAHDSDYEAATDLVIITLMKTISSNNWMHTIITNNGNDGGWLLTSDYADSDYARKVNSSGDVGYGLVYTANVVTPVLYLKSSLSIESGDGSESNPYKLSV